MCFIWIRSKFNKFKTEILRNFELRNLVETCSNLMTKSYNMSIGLSHIYYGNKNKKRFKLCVIHCIFSWIISFISLAFLISDNLYPIIGNGFLPRPLFLLVVILLFFVLIIKCDFLFGEINYNLSPIKLAYIVSRDMKSKHKLTDYNFNRLAISLRILMVLLIYYFLPFGSIMLLLIEILLLIKSNNKLELLIFETLMTPFYINGFIVLTVCFVAFFIAILYYKMRFDQIHQQTKSIIPNANWKFIIKQREKLLSNLIDEHNQVAIQVHQLNMMIRRSNTAIFICFSLAKIISLYLMLNTKDKIIKIFAVNISVIYFTLGLALTYLFSIQINSAHQSLKFMHFVVCRYKMKLKLRLKVKKISA